MYICVYICITHPHAHAHTHTHTRTPLQRRARSVSRDARPNALSTATGHAIADAHPTSTHAWQPRLEASAVSMNRVHRAQRVYLGDAARAAGNTDGRCICMYVCVYMCIRIYIYVGVCVYTHMYTRVYTHIYTHICMCICICIYIYIYYVCVCMYIRRCVPWTTPMAGWHFRIFVYICILYIYVCI